MLLHFDKFEKSELQISQCIQSSNLKRSSAIFSIPLAFKLAIAIPQEQKFPLSQQLQSNYYRIENIIRDTHSQNIMICQIRQMKMLHRVKSQIYIRLFLARPLRNGNFTISIYNFLALNMFSNYHTYYNLAPSLSHSDSIYISSNCLKAIQNTWALFLTLSGKTIQHIGNYESCTQHQNMVHNFLRFQNATTNQPLPIYSGICLPKICSTMEVGSFINNILLKPPFNQLGLSILSIQRSDTSIQKEWTFYLPIFILVTIGIFVLLSTLLLKDSKSLNSQNQQSKIKSSKLNFLKEINLINSLKFLVGSPAEKSSYDSRIDALDGIRAMAMLWIVICHNQTETFKTSINFLTINLQVQTYYYLFIGAGFMAVDTFFFLSGFLLAYLALKRVSRSSSIFKTHLSFFSGLFFRYLRLLPTYLLTLIFFTYTFPYLGSGPFWSSLGTIFDCCSGFGWLRSLAYIDNFYANGSEMCMNWGWYLQCDMQLFAIGLYAITLYSYFRNNKLISNSIIGLGVLCILFGIIYTFVIAQNEGYKQVTHLEDAGNWGSYFLDVYMKPWARAPAYMIGMLFGGYYTIMKQSLVSARKEIEVQSNAGINPTTTSGSIEENSSEGGTLIVQKMENIPKFLSYSYGPLCLEILGVLLMLAVILSPRTLQLGIEWPQILHSLYLSSAKLFFLLGLCLLLLPSLFLPRPLNSSLGCWHLKFVARISYCVYLVHLMPIYHQVYSLRFDYYYTQFNALLLLFPRAFLGGLFGFLLSLFVEVPFANLIKKLFK